MDAKAPPALLTPEMKGVMSINPTVNAAAVIELYQGNVLGKDGDMKVMTDELYRMIGEVRKGNLGSLEAMLLSQAVSLQTMFASLARRAQTQTYQRNTEAFLGLALKAQAQSRATISTLVELKYPRQATFVKQANIAHGPQQVNNGHGDCKRRSRTEKIQAAPNELLEKRHEQFSSGLDGRASNAAESGHSTVAAVGEIHRPKKLRGKGALGL